MWFSLPHSDHNYQFTQHCHKLLLHCFVILFEGRILYFAQAGSSGGEEVMYESQMRRIAQIFRIMRILRWTASGDDVEDEDCGGDDGDDHCDTNGVNNAIYKIKLGSSNWHATSLDCRPSHKHWDAGRTYNITINKITIIICTTMTITNNVTTMTFIKLISITHKSSRQQDRVKKSLMLQLQRACPTYAGGHYGNANIQVWMLMMITMVMAIMMIKDSWNIKDGEILAIAFVFFWFYSTLYWLLALAMVQMIVISS